MKKQNMKKYIYRFSNLWILIIFAVVLFILFFLHDTFEEWDGVMQYFAGKEILSGSGYIGWTSHFWPPLYSLLLGIGSLFISGFAAAKLVSIVSGVLLLYVSYKFALELTGQKKIGLLTQLFLILNPLYFKMSLYAENNMLDSLFFVSAILFLLRSIKEPTNRKLFVTGLLCGLAGLSRYTSYPLVPIAVITLFLFLDFKKAFRLCLAFGVGFTIVSLPWWWYNTITNGLPFYTWQYMNIGAAVAPKYTEWWWSLQSKFNNIIQIFSAMPLAYLKNFASNLFASSQLLIIYTGVLAPFTLPAIFDSFISLNLKQLVILWGLLISFVALVSQAFVFDKVFLSWYVILTVLSILFLLKFLALCQERYQILRKYRFDILVIAVLLIAGLSITSYKAISFLRDQSNYGELADNNLVIKALKKYDPNINTKYLMSIHPASAYHTGAKYLMIPLFYEGELEGLVSYEGLSERVKTHAPKYPANVPNSNLKADYLIYDVSVQRFLPQFSYLLDPTSNKIPQNFKVIYRSSQVVVYKIMR